MLVTHCRILLDRHAVYLFICLQMKGTLSLGPDTELINLPPETKKKGFKFELTTASANNERKVNRFKVTD